MKVEIVNFTPTELIIENYFIFRKIGKICYITGYCKFSSISANSNNILGVLSIKPIVHIRDFVAVSNRGYNPPESLQYITFQPDNGNVVISTNTAYQSMCLYGSYVFICK